MRNPLNRFKRAIAEGRPQIGMWLGLADGYAAELLATVGFDWLLVDGEHAPNDLRSVLHQLQSIAAYGAHPVVRPPEGSVTLIKQLLDTGAQSLLIPMVESAEQAAALVAATRYPPHGVRGVGSAPGPRGGIRSTAICSARAKRSACWSRSKQLLHSSKRPRSPPFQASMECSSALRTFRHRWVCLASPDMQMSWSPSVRESGPLEMLAKLPASCLPTGSSPSDTSRRERPSWPSPSIRLFSCRARAPSARPLKRATRAMHALLPRLEPY